MITKTPLTVVKVLLLLRMRNTLSESVGLYAPHIMLRNIPSVVLLDLSMPVLDGISATTEIRQIESRRRRVYENSESSGPSPRASKILALTGMSSLEDKRRAFEAGVDG